jgi:hypothetical protein
MVAGRAVQLQQLLRGHEAVAVDWGDDLRYNVIIRLRISTVALSVQHVALVPGGLSWCDSVSEAKPFSSCGNDDRIYSHSVRPYRPYHASSFTRTSGSGRVGSISLRVLNHPWGQNRLVAGENDRRCSRLGELYV